MKAQFLYELAYRFAKWSFLTGSYFLVVYCLGAIR